MKKILYYLRENLEITTREAKSTLAFLVTALISFGAYVIVSTLTHTDYAQYTLITYSTALEPEKDTVGPKFRFDPNTASAEDFAALGIPARTAGHIINYRNKGGKFRYREDLRKIYSLKAEVYTELEPWISLPLRTAVPPKPEGRPRRDSLPTKRASIQPLDINSADTTALKALRGIGSVYARRIVRFRDALGGFHSVDQLDETYGIPPETLSAVKKAIVIGTPVKPIPVNGEETFRHPYLKAYQVRAILAYRQQHGPFTSAQELSAVKVLDEETLKKIEPYLLF